MQNDEPKFRRVSGRLTDEQRQRHAVIRAQVEKDRARLSKEAWEAAAEIRQAHEAMKLLRAERESRGLTLDQIAERSGIDRSRLSKLETDLGANPTFRTVQRIAKAIGVVMTIGFRDAA